MSKDAGVMRGMSLVELTIALAILSVLTALAVAATGPLAAVLRTRQGAELVLEVTSEAQQRARAVGRCVRVHVPAADTVVLEEKASADCEETAGAWVERDRWTMPSGVPVRVDVNGAAPVFRPNGRPRQGTAAALVVGTAGRERWIRVAPQGAVCLGEQGGSCP